jgi:hypothetical protein
MILQAGHLNQVECKHIDSTARTLEIDGGSEIYPGNVGHLICG